MLVWQATNTSLIRTKRSRWNIEIVRADERVLTHLVTFTAGGFQQNPFIKTYAAMEADGV